MYRQLQQVTCRSCAHLSSRQYATRRVIKESPIPAMNSIPACVNTAVHALANQAEALPAGNVTQPAMFLGPLWNPTQVGLSPSLTQAPEDAAAASGGKDENVDPALFHRGEKFERIPYWQSIGRWKDASEEDFLSYAWQIKKSVQGKDKLFAFLNEVLPEEIPAHENYKHITTRELFIHDVLEGIKAAPMSIRLTPHILSVIDWKNPLGDPIVRQFIPMKSLCLPDHHALTLDSLHEEADSPDDLQGLVHRYPDKVLFLATSVCGLYCRFCTRSYAVGANTDTVEKRTNKPIKTRWDSMLDYIRSNPVVQDVVLSGGDSHYLLPEQLRYIGDALLDIPHIRRFRVASKGLCVSPSRTLDPNDTWTDELIRLSQRGKARGKQVALHTHFNHPSEITWVTREASQKLYANGVMVRNQSVLMRGVNDNLATMSALIRELADSNIQPYYVYQCDMVKGVEDLRTPLQVILDLEQNIRGTIAGFLVPSFVVDLPGGGGKRLAASYESYDRKTGVSRFKAPAVKGKIGHEKEDKVYEYWDPTWSLLKNGE